MFSFAMNDWASSYYRLPQQVDTPSLNGNTLSMRLSKVNMFLDSEEGYDDDEDEDDVPESPESIGEINETTSSSSQSQSAAQLNDNTLSMRLSKVNMFLDSEEGYDDDEDEDDVPESPESIGEINETTSSSSQSQSAAQAHSIWTASSKSSQCTVCGKGFYAQKAVKRHLDDVHSEPKKCPQPECPEMIKGSRKLKVHLKKAHNILTPTRTRKWRH